MSSDIPPALAHSIDPAARFAIAAARFNRPIVEALQTGCLRRFGELGVGMERIDVHHVPGAFELPLAAQWLAQTKTYAAVVCLGAVIRGDTPHFDYVAGECAKGIARVALDESLPVIFGVLTVNTQQQALDRVGGPHGHAGERAAEAAAEMAALRQSVEG
jgi:6,7-dimethyl-8-ribityllumazine synthase